MKPHILLKSLFLLFTLLFNFVLLDCKKINSNSILQRHRKHQIRYSRTVTHNFVFDKLKEIALVPENLLFFVLGALSVFESTFEIIYKQIRPYVEGLRYCIDLAKDIFEKISKSKDHSDLEQMLIKNESLKKIENDFLKIENKKEYCENIKSEIHTTFVEATKEGYGNSGGWQELYNKIPVLPNLTYAISSKLVPTKNKCRRILGPAPNTQQKIAEKFGSVKEYYHQCLFFSKLNCDDFDPETKGLFSFIVKAFDYYYLISNTKDCLISAFNGGKAEELVRVVFKSSKINDYIANAVGAVANVFTLGAWGGIKGGYYLIQLALDIAHSYLMVTQDLAFNIGKIFGKAILIAKSLITGKKKLRKIKK